VSFAELLKGEGKRFYSDCPNIYLTFMSTVYAL